MTNCRSIARLTALAVIASGIAACATSSPSSRTPLRPVSACPDLNRTPEMYTPDNRTIIMKTGPSFYRVDLMNNCGQLNATTLNFKLANGMSGARRLCGDVGDEVVNVDGMHCAVRSVTRIDKKQFDALQAQSRAR